MFERLTTRSVPARRRSPRDATPAHADRQQVRRVLQSGGERLPPAVRTFFEPRLGSDLSVVRVYTTPAANESARALGARAYTFGNDIVFGRGEYTPDSADGRRLLAHELTHVQQQRGSTGLIQRDLYTPEERKAMSEGRVAGTAVDVGIAAGCNFQPGDIVFRLGSGFLGWRIDEPVTHGGIYLGDGLIHDVVGFGNRTVPAVDFYNEAADSAVVKIIRFKGPLADIIISRLIRNIRAQDFDLPTDKVPWNLFSSANDYATATCLEYAHAQFLYAIQQLSREPVLSAAKHAELQSTYFRAGGLRPAALIQPRTLLAGGGMPVNERQVLVLGADVLAEDVDPRVFQNRWEGHETSHALVERLDAFTYSSFVDATRFFTARDCPRGTGGAVDRYRAQVRAIGAEPTVCSHVACVSKESTVVWAERGDGKAYLVQVQISHVSGLIQDMVRFRAFVDQDLSVRALARATALRPEGVQSVKWSAISDIPDAPMPTTAVRR